MITLTTIVYEGNFRKILNDNSWFFKFQSDFISKKRITVNNINSYEEFDGRIDHLKKYFDFEVSFVDEHINLVNSKLQLDTYRTTHGFDYTMPYFVNLLTVSTQYIFNVSSDCQIDIKVCDDFFEKSIQIIDNDDDVVTTTVPWGKPETFGTKNTLSVGDLEQQQHNILKTNDDFWFSMVMSDQVFFTKVDKLLQCDFKIEGNLHPYPPYGGFCFEKRIGNHLITNKKFRAIYKGESYYIHGKD